MFWLFCLSPLFVLLPQILELFGFQIFLLLGYPMKVIPETRRTYWIWYLRVYDDTETNFWNSTWTKPDIMPIASDSSQSTQLSADFLLTSTLFTLLIWLLDFECYYTRLYNFMTDSFIRGNRLPRDNHYLSTSNYQTLIIFWKYHAIW